MALSGRNGSSVVSPQGEAESLARQGAWAATLPRDTLPDFVTERLGAAGQAKPWISTLSPAELLLGTFHIAPCIGEQPRHFGAHHQIIGAELVFLSVEIVAPAVEQGDRDMGDLVLRSSHNQGLSSPTSGLA